MSSLLINRSCCMCGGIMAKPNPWIRFFILANYFTMSFSSIFFHDNFLYAVSIFIIGISNITLLVGFIYRLPYFSLTVSKMFTLLFSTQMASIVAVLSNLLLKESEDINEATTILFYFLTYCFGHCSLLIIE